MWTPSQKNKTFRKVVFIMSNLPDFTRGTVAKYRYNFCKPTGNIELDRIRTFLKTEINTPINNRYGVTYTVDIAENSKDGRFYALKSHYGTKSVTVKKAYRFEDLVYYLTDPYKAPEDFNPSGFQCKSNYPDINIRGVAYTLYDPSHWCYAYNTRYKTNVDVYKYIMNNYQASVNKHC